MTTRIELPRRAALAMGMATAAAAATGRAHAQAQPTVKIALLAPMSGPWARQGAQMHRRLVIPARMKRRAFLDMRQYFIRDIGRLGREHDCRGREPRRARA